MCMPNLVTFEQLFRIFLGCLTMQVDFAKNRPCRNRATYAYARTCIKQ